MSEWKSTAFFTEQLRWERAEKDVEIERLRAALGEIGALTAEPKLYDHEEAMSDRLDAIYKHVREALGE